MSQVPKVNKEDEDQEKNSRSFEPTIPNPEAYPILNKIKELCINNGRDERLINFLIKPKYKSLKTHLLVRKEEKEINLTTFHDIKFIVFTERRYGTLSNAIVALRMLIDK
jgi:hypothetical protein